MATDFDERLFFLYVNCKFREQHIMPACLPPFFFPSLKYSSTHAKLARTTSLRNKTVIVLPEIMSAHTLVTGYTNSSGRWLYNSTVEFLVFTALTMKSMVL
jgi:hypothetical protein